MTIRSFLATSLKRLLIALGARLSARTLYALNRLVDFLELGAFLRRHGFATEAWVDQRSQIFELIARQVGEDRVLYLEFGVHEGASIREWSKLLRHPEAQLHGFDSFEGLPSDWLYDRPSGTFSTAGRTPEIDDPRVRFFVGWFEDTLPDYEWPAHEALVVNCDADLYSSTATVLRRSSRTSCRAPSCTSTSSTCAATRCGPSPSCWIALGCRSSCSLRRATAATPPSGGSSQAQRSRPAGDEAPSRRRLREKALTVMSGPKGSVRRATGTAGFP